MNERDSIKVFDWHRMFYSENIPISYLGEIGFRTVVMFVVLIFALKLLSKRGVKQLSVFELAILIALGSATGACLRKAGLNTSIIKRLVCLMINFLLNYE